MCNNFNTWILLDICGYCDCVTKSKVKYTSLIPDCNWNGLFRSLIYKIALCVNFYCNDINKICAGTISIVQKRLCQIDRIWNNCNESCTANETIQVSKQLQFHVKRIFRLNNYIRSKPIQTLYTWPSFISPEEKVDLTKSTKTYQVIAVNHAFGGRIKKCSINKPVTY